MDREDGTRPVRDRLGDELWPHEERLGVDVDEHGACPAQLDGVRGRGEGVRGDDHLVARADPEREER